MMRVLSRSFQIVLTTAVLSAGCSHGKKVASEFPEQQPTVTDVPVWVQNHNWMDVVIYAVRGGTRSRLGQVTSMSEVTFTVKASFLGAGNDLRLLVDPIGSNDSFITDVL